ncbi:MAG: phosphonate ABC transporter ATP-binding protein [Rhodospirillaceae bacterium]|nr:phosphonate ABC transporter ATP-binding protein [Rhodospirillaceae bacterium]
MRAIEIGRLSKTFGRGGRAALAEIDLVVGRGEMVGLIGASGSGKSTLIRHVAGLLTGDRGSGPIKVLGETVQDDGALTAQARQVRARIGVIFQQFNLVDRLSLLTNVVLGALGRVPGWRGALGLFTRQERLLAMEALHQVGMADQAMQRASTLSGGQQQRAAIARALVQQAQLVLADEPIASLDPKSARRVMEILSHINRTFGITVMVSLHQIDYAFAYCPRTLALRDGRIVYDGPSRALTPAVLTDLYGAQSEELILPGSWGQPAAEDCDVGAPIGALVSVGAI